eukprot:474290-Prorocentrum_lima.AAC.1
MTSSLVGSEMCIRDRPCTCPWSSSGFPWSGGRRRTSHQWPTNAGCARPVSYTHLTLPTICSV